MREINKEIIERAKEGNREAMSEIFEVYRNYVGRSAYIMIGNFDIAEDITENVFFKVFTNLKSFDIERDFKPWLSRITLNETRNYIQKNKNYISEENEDLNLFESQNTLNKEEIIDIREGLKRLSTSEREIIALRYYQELTVEEISRILRIPKNTIKVKIHRTLKKLRGLV